ncbi:MAG: DNA replication/repair protein RecF [Proteobacteria bacterium]|nr:DNA replication/repair protein RecF [Pseudomonadota bacterium]
MVARCRVNRLQITDFRTYAHAEIHPGGGLVVLTGENGTGKTNLLEAVSLLTQGRGLRRADLSDMVRQSGGGGFAVAADAEGGAGPCQLGTGLIRGEPGRKARINRAPVSSVAAFADHMRIVWLTPDQDGLFRGGAGDRRRFLDRLVLAVDPGHGARISALERALRARNRLVEQPSGDDRWLDAAEREVAELGIAAAAARQETVDRLAHLIAETRGDHGPFPHAEIALEGALESQLRLGSAGAAEDWYRAALAESRPRDRAAGRTLIGPQTSDLVVRHGPKDMPAHLSSTGEQKALLIGIVLAHARLVASMSGMAPLVLMDEVAAHLDPVRRSALVSLLGDLGGQIWMTGADPAQFSDLPRDAARFLVSPGAVRPLD